MICEKCQALDYVIALAYEHPRCSKPDCYGEMRPLPLPPGPHTRKLSILDSHTFEYDGTKISIELLDALVNPGTIPSRWMRVTKKDPETGLVTMEVPHGAGPQV